jgi:hypothetical protein
MNQVRVLIERLLKQKPNERLRVSIESLLKKKPNEQIKRID